MPRIFAPAEGFTSTQGYVDFTNGAAAVDADETTAIAFFTAQGFDIDTSKDVLTPLDVLTRAQLDDIATYMGLTLVPADGKYEVIRDIEGVISTAKLATLTVASSAGTESGDTNIDVTGEGTGQLKYQLTTSHLSPLWMDYASDDDWTDFTDNDDITATTGKIINVVEVDDDDYIVGFGYQTVTSKA